MSLVTVLRVYVFAQLNERGVTYPIQYTSDSSFYMATLNLSNDEDEQFPTIVDESYIKKLQKTARNISKIYDIIN